MAAGFRARVARSYVLKGQRVLVLREGYEGDIEVGDRVELDVGGAEPARGIVASIAWGSAFHAEDPPLTLVVDGVADADPVADAEVRGLG